MWNPGHIKFAKHLLHSILLLLKFIALSKSKCYSQVPILKKKIKWTTFTESKRAVWLQERVRKQKWNFCNRTALSNTDSLLVVTANVGWESQSKDTNLQIRNRSSRQCEMKIDFRLCPNIASLFCGSGRKRSYFSKSYFMALHRVGATWDLVAVVNNAYSPVFVALSLAFLLNTEAAPTLSLFLLETFQRLVFYFYFLATDDSEDDLYGTYSAVLYVHAPITIPLMV